MKVTKFAFAAALCALFVVQAEARTLYVNAKRPNNKGNGYKASTAKKTIQAAINIAKKGDTILVYPGTYAPIKTDNKKITIKSVKGKAKSAIVLNDPRKWGTITLLGKVLTTYEYQTTYKDINGQSTYGRFKVARTSVKGTATALQGFSLKGTDSVLNFVEGGTVKSCTLQGSGKPRYGRVSVNAKLEDCLVKGVYCCSDGYRLLSGTTLNRCKIINNVHAVGAWKGRVDPSVESSEFYNCLLHGNSLGAFSDSIFVNCTIADNLCGIEVYNDEDCNPLPSLSTNSKYYNCILRNNYSQFVRHNYNFETHQDEFTFMGPMTLHNVDSGNTYKNTDKTNKNPKFVNAAKGNYKLKKGSYAIDAGRLNRTQMKQLGTKDLAGGKRVKGKYVDRGCYEY